MLTFVKSLIPRKTRRKLRKYFRCFYSKKNISTWCLDRVDIRDDTVEIHGWAIAPNVDFIKKGIYGFSINNNLFHRMDYPIPREDILKILWDIPGALNSGFSCKIAIKKKELFLNGYAEFSFIDRETKKPLREEHNYYCCDPTIDNLIPIPGSERRSRVHGSSTKEAFLLEGFTNYMKLNYALNKKAGKNFKDISAALDWGCGCGRLARYFKDFSKTSFTGVDIDSDNIQWCRKNLPFGSYFEIPKYPPTTLPDSAFDLIIGISVFTHLEEENQFLWLKELHRIACKGAILLMTVHGQDAVIRGNLSPDLLLPLKIKGFWDAGHNLDLGEAIDSNGYYRNVYHSTGYIRKKWSKYFEVIDIIPGCIGNLQDMIVLRKN